MRNKICKRCLGLNLHAGQDQCLLSASVAAWYRARRVNAKLK